MLASYILKILVQKNQKDATHIKKYTLMNPVCKMKELLTKRGKKARWYFSVPKILHFKSLHKYLTVHCNPPK